MLKFNQFISENKGFSEHSYYLPTYEECRAICDAHDKFLFYETKHTVDGYSISIFNYRLATSTHFENPIPGKDIKAYEMRGISFVWNKDGSLFKRFLLLDKFFNVDQTPCSAYSVIKEYKIRNIFNKEDGSIASFVQLPNGKIVGKSKASFESEQAVEIQNIYDNDPNIRSFLTKCFNNDVMAVFEYVSPSNRIVVPYAETGLILLRLRDNNTGEYIDVDDYKEHLTGITVAESYDDLGLDELIELKAIIKEKEGWIIQFTNGKMAKIKTDWYCDLHGLFTDDLSRENKIIKMILDETIDDVIAQVAADRDKDGNVMKHSQIVIDEVNEIIEVVNFKISQIKDEVEDLLSNYGGVIGEEDFYALKHFALKYKKDELFSIAISHIRSGDDVIDKVKEFISVKTSHLEKARKWLDESRKEFNNE